MAERIIGIDFGTSTSVIRVKRYENGKPLGEVLETKEVMFGGSGAMVPTLIMKKDDDPSVAYYGYEAKQKKRKFMNYSSFKVDLESTNAEKRAEARKLTEEFFAFMGKQYRDQSDGSHLDATDDKQCTIISYPVKWSEETKRFMIDAAKKAGFPNASGMDEAQAAIHAVTIMSTGYLQQHGLLKNGVASNILLIDMGAGTTDLVLCQYTPGTAKAPKILNTWPKSGKILFGGKEIDALLKNYFWDKMDEADAQMVFKRIGTDKFKSWKEESVSPALRNNDSVSDFEVLDNCVEMMDIDMDEYCFDRTALEKCLENYLKQLPVLINGCIYNSGIKGSDVDLVIVTGGHSQWYFVQDILEGKMPQFGNVNLPKIKENPARIIPITRPQETVALGLVYSPMQSAIPVVSGPVPLKPDPPKPVSPKPVPPKPNPPKPVPPKPPVDEEYTPESEFELLADGENYVISNYTGNRKVVVIPPKIRGRKVIAIDHHAFSQSEFSGFLKLTDKSTIERVVIPDSVTQIGEYAFFNCRNLHTVIAHSRIKTIDKCAFCGCKNLEILDFGSENVMLGHVKFPKELERLGDHSFAVSTFNPACIFKEVTISKKTEWFKKDTLFTTGWVAFDDSTCALFYYD